MSFLKLTFFLFIISILHSCVQAPGISTFTELGRTIKTKNITLTVSGMINGMSAIVSTNGQSMTITGNGIFNFTPLLANTSYNFIISSVSPGYNCEISNNIGVLTDNLSLTMTCGSLGPYTISAKISGLLASSVSLSNGSDTILNSQNGTYSFSTSQEYGTSYNIIITLQPTAHTCAAVSSSGFVTGNMVINVVCTPNTFTLGGTFSGIEPAETAVLEVNSLVGSNSLTLNGVTSGVSTGFTFTNSLFYNQAYSVKLVSQPANKICFVTNSSGTIFNNINNISVTCSNRTATNCSFGSVTPWAGNLAFAGTYCDGTHVYVGGSFTGLGPQARHFALINNTDVSPIPDSRMPGLLVATPNSPEKRIVISDEEGGWFTGGYGNQSPYILRHLKSDLSINPVFSSSLNYISTLKIIGNHLFVGSGSSNSLKKINRFTGVLEATFTPSITGQIHDIEYDGTYLYVGGLITSAGGSAKKGITKIHATTGVVDHTFTLSLTSDAAQTTVTSVYAIKIYNNNLYIGGDFTYVNGGGTTPRLIKANLNGVVDTAFSPSPNNSVYKLDVFQNKLLVAGQFTNIFSQSKRALAVIDVGGDHLLSNFFNESITGGLAEVNTMHLNSTNGLLYLAFNHSGTNLVNGISRSYQAVYDLINKTVGAQEAKVNSQITSMASYGSQVFMAGYFTSAYRDSQAYFARIKLSDGKRDTTFNPTINSIVHDLIYDVTDNSLFLGGNFTSPGSYLAKFRIDTQTWDGSFNPTYNSYVNKIHLYNNKIFTSGNFSTPRNKFAVVSPTSGAVDNAYPDLSPNQIPFLYAANSYGAFLGGTFTSIDSLTTSSYLARVNHIDGRVTDNYFPAAPSALVNHIIPVGSTLVVGGSFANYNGSGKNNGVLFELNPSVSLDNTFNATFYGSGGATSSCAIGTTLYTVAGNSVLYTINYTTGSNSILQSYASNMDKIQCQNSQYYISGAGLFSIGP